VLVLALLITVISLVQRGRSRRHAGVAGSRVGNAADNRSVFGWAADRHLLGNHHVRDVLGGDQNLRRRDPPGRGSSPFASARRERRRRIARIREQVRTVST